MMRAWISGEPPGIEHIEIAEIARPKAGPNDLLVKVDYGALNFSDLLMIADRYQVRPPRPFTPGQELSGTVVEAPAGGRFSAGDKIASKVLWGAFSEYALVRSDMAIAIPATLDQAAAAALPVVYVTALVALDHCTETKPGDVGLVHAAAGGIGLAAVEVSKARGATVVATAGSAEKLELARLHGADHLIDYNDNDWVDLVKQVTDGAGADIIVDPVGGRIGEDSLRCIANDGVLLIVGFASGEMPKLAAHRLLLKRATAKGVYWNHDTDRSMLAEMTREMSRLLAANQLRPVIGGRYGFDALKSALSDLAARKIAGKAVLTINPRQGA